MQWRVSSRFDGMHLRAESDGDDLRPHMHAERGLSRRPDGYADDVQQRNLHAVDRIYLCVFQGALHWEE